MTSGKNILVAVDTSDEARQVLGSALELARCYEAKLSLIHVLEPVVTESSYDLISSIPVEMDGLLHERAEKFIEALKKEYAPQLASNELLAYVETGSVKAEILRHAEENQVDLIVVGSHGRHGLGLLLGSTANALLHGAPCDIYVVRIKDGA